MTQYDDKITDILTNVEEYHSAYYAAETFRGPSLYFHKRSLETRQSTDFDLHLEYVYATLASWGMHRMGKGGSKMHSFEAFKTSVEAVKDRIAKAQRIDSRCVTEADWGLLEEIFKGINIMASRTSIVGNSKVMAHMIPNVVPPIDRRYTLKYLTGTENIRNGLDNEWALMRGIISDFFVPVARDPDLSFRAGGWISNQSKYPWDTSVFKLIDNLVIGARK